MVSPEMIRAYPFFSGFTLDQVVDLSMVARELEVEPGYTFINENQEVHHFYLIRDGKASICIAVPHRQIEHTFQQQIYRDLVTEDVIISTLEDGELFGWSAIIPPHEATASVKAITPCRVIEFDYLALTPKIEENCCLGHLLTLKAAQVVRERLRDLRVENLVSISEMVADTV
jgi:CRP-like cAMP-binding protein